MMMMIYDNGDGDGDDDDDDDRDDGSQGDNHEYNAKTYNYIVILLDAGQLVHKYVEYNTHIYEYNV